MESMKYYLISHFVLQVYLITLPSQIVALNCKYENIPPIKKHVFIIHFTSHYQNIAKTSEVSPDGLAKAQNTAMTQSS